MTIRYFIDRLDLVVFNYMIRKLFELIMIVLLAATLCACGTVSLPEEATGEINSADDTVSDEPAGSEDATAAADEESEAEEPAIAVLDVNDMSFATLTEEWRDDEAVVAAWAECHDYLEAFIWEPVESSALQEAAYSWLWQAAAVRFNSNPAAVYVYHDVPEDVYHQMISADSIGGYFNQYIKGQYECERFDL